MRGHQRFDVRKIRRHRGRLRKHSLALLREMLERQDGIVQLLVNLAAGMSAKVVLHDQQAGPGQRRRREYQREKEFGAQPDFDHVGKLPERNCGGAVRKKILKLDESCISNPRSEIANWTGLNAKSHPKFRDFGFEMQDSSNFKIFSQLL